MLLRICLSILFDNLGSVTISEVEDHCKTYHGSVNAEKTSFQGELKAMIGSESCVLRLQQLAGCRKLASYFEDAKLMLDVQEALALTDDPRFESYRRIVKTVGVIFSSYSKNTYKLCNKTVSSS